MPSLKKNTMEQVKFVFMKTSENVFKLLLIVYDQTSISKIMYAISITNM
jgi:hypothetical protein